MDNIAYIFVDGSFNEATAQVAAAFTVTDESLSEIKLQQTKVLTDAESVSHRQIAGEVQGSTMAIQWAIDNGYDEVDIYYDYMGIQMWAEKDWRAKNPTSQAYAAFVDKAQLQITIKFHKVPAHTGVELNEATDRLAKDAIGVK